MVSRISPSTRGPVTANHGLEPTPSSVRSAPAFGRGSGPALGAKEAEMSTQNKLAKTHIRWAIRHIAKEGDTDIIATPFEHKLLRKHQTRVIDQLSRIDISSHNWRDTRRFISQKDMVSFRPVCQLDPIDAILFAALISQNKNRLNAYLAKFRRNVYSHELVCSNSGEMYERRDGWMRFWQDSSKKASREKCNFVAVTDVVDYYNQIYHHTLENQLDEAKVSRPHKTALKNLLQFETDKVSRGIPVGPHPSHALAELAMAPIDGFLNQSGIEYSRYVDDFHLFVESESKATLALGQLAQALDSQKLSLNRSKTRVFPRDEFIDHAHRKSISDPINAIEGRLLELLSDHIDDPYDELDIEELDDDEQEELFGLAVDEVLTEYLEADRVDYPRIGWLLRRLAQVGTPGAAKFVVQNLGNLLPVVSDVAKYLSRVDIEVGAALQLGELLVESLKNDVISHSEYLAACILSSFSDSPEFNNFGDIEIFYHGNPMVKRKIVLAASAQKKADWIRGIKRDFSSADTWLKRAIILACGRLPKDEALTYITVHSPNHCPIS